MSMLAVGVDYLSVGGHDPLIHILPHLLFVVSSCMLRVGRPPNRFSFCPEHRNQERLGLGDLYLQSMQVLREGQGRPAKFLRDIRLDRSFRVAQTLHMENLKQLRRRERLSLKEVSSAIGWSEAGLSRAENDKQMLLPNLGIALAELYNVSLDVIYDRKPLDPKPKK